MVMFFPLTATEAWAAGDWAKAIEAGQIDKTQREIKLSAFFMRLETILQGPGLKSALEKR
jgi:hypothetical protein